MKEKIQQIKKEVVKRAGDTFTAAVRAAMNDEKASFNAKKAKDEYRGMPSDALADILTKRAARKTKWEGMLNGLGVSGCEVVVAAPAPEPLHKVAATSGIVTMLLGDLAYTTRIQMQLLLEIAEVYDCPFDRDDEEDVFLVFKAALGLKGVEKVGGYGRYIFVETARKQFRKLLRYKGIRAAVQELVIKIAGNKIGRLLGEKWLLRLIPLANAGFGYAFNSKVTNKVGQWAKVKAKIRASAFKHVKLIESEDSSELIWVLPVIFYVGTADDRLTDNLLTLYSQTKKRTPLNEEQLKRVEQLIDDEDLSDVFEFELPKIKNMEVKKALYDIALTSATVNLKPEKEHEICLSELANDFGIEYSERDLKKKLNYLKR